MTSSKHYMPLPHTPSDCPVSITPFRHPHRSIHSRPIAPVPLSSSRGRLRLMAVLRMYTLLRLPLPSTLTLSSYPFPLFPFPFTFPFPFSPSFFHSPEKQKNRPALYILVYLLYKLLYIIYYNTISVITLFPYYICCTPTPSRPPYRGARVYMYII